MIKRFIDNLDDDKKDHVLLGIITGYPLIIIGFIIDLIFGFNFMAIIGGLIGIILVGAKEVIHDWIQGKGNPDWWDFIASAIPILFPLLFLLFQL